MFWADSLWVFFTQDAFLFLFFFILSYKGPYSLKAMVLTASPPSNTRNSMAPAKSLPLLKPQLPRLETKALDYVGVE